MRVEFSYLIQAIVIVAIGCEEGDVNSSGDICYLSKAIVR